MRRKPLERRTPLKAHTELKRGGELKRSAPKSRRGAISPATPAQRARVKDRACIVCAAHPCQPAHLIDRSLAPEAGDRVVIVVPLCPPCHYEYDEGSLDLSPYLEPHWRDSVAAAVEAVGLLRALKRITKATWTVVPSEQVSE